MKLSLDGVRVQSETTYVWASPYVLSVHPVIPQPDLAIELQILSFYQLRRGAASDRQPAEKAEKAG